MSKITADDVRKVAQLARLALPEEKIATYTGQLERILDYVTQLEAVDTEGVPPTTRAVEVVNVTRADVVTPDKRAGGTAKSSAPAGGGLHPGAKNPGGLTGELLMSWLVSANRRHRRSMQQLQHPSARMAGGHQRRQRSQLAALLAVAAYPQENVIEKIQPVAPGFKQSQPLG